MFGCFKAVFWLSLSVFSTWHFGKIVVNSLFNFSKETTSYHTTVIVSDSLYFENASLCVDISPNYILPANIKEYQLNRSLDEFTRKQLDFLTNYSYEPMSKMSDLLLNFTYQMISEISSNEYIFESPNRLKTRFHWGVKRGYLVNPNSATAGLVNRLIFLTHKYYTDNSVNFIKLKRTVAYHLCKRLNATLHIVKNGMKSTVDICSPIEILALSHKHVCFKLSTVEDPLELGPTDYFRVSVKSESSESQKGIHLFLDGNPYPLTNNTKPTIFVPFDTSYKAVAEIQGVYRNTDTKRRPCLNKISRNRCLAKCHAEFIVENCACWPLYFGLEPTRPIGLTVCGQKAGKLQKIQPYYIPTVSECLAGKNFTQKDAETCELQCPKDCYQTKVSVNLADKASSLETKLRISIKKSQYPLVIEQVSVNLYQLISDLCLNVVFWLLVCWLVLIYNPVIKMCECSHKMKKL